MSIWSRKPLVAVRLLGPDGYDPHLSVQSRHHCFGAADGVAWTAVLQPPVPEDWELPETPTLIPEEIRLHAAIQLCVANPSHHGMPTVTLLTERLEEGVDETCDLSSIEGQDRVGGLLRSLLARYPSIMRDSGRSEYHFGEIGSADEVLSLLAGINPTDELLLAGLANFCTASRLMAARVNERDAAALCMFVSMQAALEYLRLSLNHTRGVGNASFADVHTYLGDIYPDGNYVPEYLEEVYDHRLMATHPASRLGEYWAVPLMADDFFDLRKHLIVIYRHIILGETPVLDS